MTFAEKVKALRKQKGLSQAELGSALGVSSRTVQSYEAGTTYPKNRDMYRQLAEFFSVDVNSLLSEEDLFIENARETYGLRGAHQAKELVSEVSGLFAGGQLAEEDMDEMMQAIQEAYWLAKKNNRKFISGR